MDNATYVWYASYGSNMNRERFLCYIRGGQPEGAEIRRSWLFRSCPPNKGNGASIAFPALFCSKLNPLAKEGRCFYWLDSFSGGLYVQPEIFNNEGAI